MFIFHSSNEELQSDNELSFVGGLPMLPEGVEIPKYEKTNEDMTFFFQMCFPDNHLWQKNIVSILYYNICKRRYIAT